MSPLAALLPARVAVADVVVTVADAAVAVTVAIAIAASAANFPDLGGQRTLWYRQRPLPGKKKEGNVQKRLFSCVALFTLCFASTVFLCIFVELGKISNITIPCAKRKRKTTATSTT